MLDIEHFSQMAQVWTNDPQRNGPVPDYGPNGTGPRYRNNVKYFHFVYYQSKLHLILEKKLARFNYVICGFNSLFMHVRMVASVMRYFK